MSSFAAFLAIQRVRYPLLTYSLAIHQQTDSLGRPASPTQGGTIDCTLNVPTTDRSAILRWMLSPTAQLDGEVLLMQDVPRTILKSIAFFNAYCVGLTMQFRSGQGGGGSLQMQVRISPERVAVGPILHDNNWPVESHGVGETFAWQERQKERQLTSEEKHLLLAGASLVPGMNVPASLSDAALYLKEGEPLDALISAAGVIPVVSLFTKGRKVVQGVKALKVLKDDDIVYAGVREASKLLKESGTDRKLRKEVLESFEKKTITVEEVKEEAVYGLRFYTKNAKGNYLFANFTPYTNRVGLALLPKWGNKMDKLASFQLKERTKYIFGQAAAQSQYYTGGSKQMYVPKIEDLIRLVVKVIMS